MFAEKRDRIYYVEGVSDEAVQTKGGYKNGLRKI